jgi:hypothetical protein
MGSFLADLDQRDRARLRAELVEVIATRLAYPQFLDFHSETQRMRPLGHDRRKEIARFVEATSFEPIERAELGAPDVRRFFEQLFLAYVRSSAEQARPAARRRLPLTRAAVLRASDEVQRGLVALAAGAPGTFGNSRPNASWAAANSHLARAEPKWERVERETQQIETALFRQQGKSDRSARSSATNADQSALARGVARPSAASPWSDVPMDGTSSMPAQRGAAGGHSPFAGLETGSQSAMFGAQSSASLTEQPTGMQPIVGLGGAPTAGPPRELPPDLLQLYNEYLGNARPQGVPGPVPLARSAAASPSTRAPARGLFGWRPPGSAARDDPRDELPPSEATAVLSARVPAPRDGKTDISIFQQLRHQVDDYIRLAARSYNVPVRGADPASALDALRRSGHVNENDLRIAESILGLADRIVAGSPATVDDYRQALMLYLLYHRSRMGS